MNWRIKKLATSARIIIAFIVLVLAIVSINPIFNAHGVAIRSVDFNSSANLGGIGSPGAGDPPRSREVITQINNVDIITEADYYDAIADLGINETVSVRTSRANYVLRTKPDIVYEETNETTIEIYQETIPVNNTDGTITNETVNKTREVPVFNEIIVGTEDLGLSVYPAPSSNIRKGLDLQGGTRVLLQPEEQLSDDDMEILLENMKERLNVFGLSDVVVRDAGDLSGNQFVMVEIAGANEEEVTELLSNQGKFEAKIGEDVVFFGGKKDVTYVCRTAECSGIDPRLGCGFSGSWSCRFRFAISLSPEAAQRQGELTRDLEIVTENANQYLSKPLSLYLDDVEVDTLQIGAELQGRATTDISISGSGIGSTQEEAIEDALTNMRRLQTILITGSLPVKLNIVKTDLISPILGKEFLRNAILIGIISLAGVVAVVFARYRKWQVALPIALTGVIEVTILMGVASMIGWNIDLASIAGIIIAIGTGVDHQIVIADETLRGESRHYDWKKKMKHAFFIIIAAYITSFVAMTPLLFAGAGLLKGFALTTIIGITIGVLVTRPMYAKIVEILLKE